MLDKGLSYTQIGTLYAVREIFINIFEIPSGILADNFGRKKSLMASLLSYLVSFIIFYFSEDFYMFLLAFVLYGVGDAFRTGTHKGMIMDYLKQKGWQKQKISYYGHTRSWSQKGSAVSSLIAGLIVYFSGSYSSVFLYSIIPYVLNLLLIWSYPEELDKSINPEKKRRGFKSSLNSLIELLKRPKVFEIISTSALHTAYLRAVKDYIQPLMLNVALIVPVLPGVDRDRKTGLIIGILYFLLYIITSGASKRASFFEEKRGKSIVNQTLFLGLALGAISGLLFYRKMWILSLVLFIGIYIIENIRKPILTGYIADNVPNENLVAVISSQSLLKTIFTSFIAFGIGAFTDFFGLGMALFILSSILISLTLLTKNSFWRSMQRN